MEDLRTQKTIKAIEQATLELIEIKGFSNVRITEIAEKALVNRNTIYLHYESKEDIVISILNRNFSELQLLLQSGRLFTGKLSRSKMRNIYLDLLENISRDIELYRIMMTDHNLNGYMSIISNKIKELAYRNMKQTISNKIVVEYMISGIYGVISRWIIYATGTKEEIASEMAELTFINIKRLVKK